MSYIVMSPKGKALWTPNCFDPDRKYPHKSGKGYYSLTLSFDRESKIEFEKSIIAQLGAKASGTVHYKSDGTGRSEVKIKCLESLTDRQGNEIPQPPKVTYKGNPYRDSFDHATVIVGFQPKFFSGYGKTSLLLKRIEIIELHDPNTLTPEEEDLAVLNAVNGSVA